MKNIFLIFLISLLSFLSTNAQRTDLIYSAEKLPEKDISKCKLEILTNGNTANVGINESFGLFCTLYDTNKKTIAHTIVPVKFEIENIILTSVFEINNEVVVMLYTYDKNIPTLSRYIFDGFTGKLKKEEIILEKPAAKTLRIVSEKELMYRVSSEIVVQKDPNSNYYAVGYFDYYAADINKNIEVIHYSPTHEIVSRAYLTHPDSKYLRSHYVALYVNGGNSVILSTFLYNVEKEQESCFYLSELKAGVANFRSVKAAIETKFYLPAEAMFIFNKVTNKVLLLSVAYANGEKGKIGGYHIISQTLNLETLALTEYINLYSEKLDAAFIVANSSDRHYSGFPQQYSINSKGNLIMLSEMGTYNYSYTGFDEIGISYWNPTGEDTYGEVIHYLHTQGTKIKSFIYARARNGRYTCGNYYDEFQETYLGLVSGTTNSYLFLNNTVERFKMPSKRPVNTPVLLSNPKFTSFIYTLNDAGIASKEYIFGEPVSETETKYCRFNTADYDPLTGLYAVIVVDKIKGKKTISVLWMNLK